MSSSERYSIKIKTGNDAWPTGAYIRVVREDFGPAFVVCSSGYASKYPTIQDAADDIENYGRWIPVQFEVMDA